MTNARSFQADRDLGTGAARPQGEPGAAAGPTSACRIPTGRRRAGPQAFRPRTVRRRPCSRSAAYGSRIRAGPRTSRAGTTHSDRPEGGRSLFSVGAVGLWPCRMLTGERAPSAYASGARSRPRRAGLPFRQCICSPHSAAEICDQAPQGAALTNPLLHSRALTPNHWGRFVPSRSAFSSSRLAR